MPSFSLHIFDDFPVVNKYGKLSTQFDFGRSRLTEMVGFMSFFNFLLEQLLNLSYTPHFVLLFEASCECFQLKCSKSCAIKSLIDYFENVLMINAAWENCSTLLILEKSVASIRQRKSHSCRTLNKTCLEISPR